MKSLLVSHSFLQKQGRDLRAQLPAPEKALPVPQQKVVSIGETGQPSMTVQEHRGGQQSERGTGIPFANG